MTVCFFGTYNPDYSRNRTLIRGLKENNIKVIEVNTDSNTKGIKKYLELIKLHHKIKHDYDVLLVAFPGFQTMIIAKLICRKKIVFDAFNSIYESTIIDRKLYSRRSLQALYYWLLNWLACVLADKIILDTNEHIKYFIKEFRIPKHKCYSIYVGTDDLIFYPQPKTTKQAKFLVHFHGSFIPLQGIEYILQAANILKSEEIQFNIIGKGQLYNKMILLAENLQLKNVKFIRFLAYEKLKDYIAEADISLGIFGNTAKAKRVIPNKVYEGLAMKIPVITGESMASKELLENKKHLLYCNFADSQDLANKILMLKNDKQLADRIAENGYQLMKEQLTPKILGSQLISIIKS